MTEKRVDIGSGHVLTLLTPDGATEPVSADVEHMTPAGQPCAGWIRLDVGYNASVSAQWKWQVESWEPLTLSPSLLCSCGDHGFVRDGRWVPA